MRATLAVLLLGLAVPAMAVAEDEFDNDDLLAPWNDTLRHDDLLAPWNDVLHKDDLLAPWNDPVAGKRETDEYLRDIGEDPDGQYGWD